MLCVKGETAKINLIVFDLTQQAKKIESLIYTTRGEHPNN